MPTDSPSPNITLDPQGLRGTSSARRVRQSRRRRQLRTLLALLLVAIGIGAASWFYLQPRAGGFFVARSQTFALDLRAPATLDGKGALWLGSREGALWQIGAEGALGKYGVATGTGAPPLVSASGGVYLAGLDGTLAALSASGKTRWTRGFGAALATTPALWRDGDLAIVAVGDSDGLVASLNASDGKTLWTTNLGGPIGNALVATRDGLLVPTLASGVWRGGLVCLDARSGRVKWRYPSDRHAAAGVAAALWDEGSNRVYWNNDEGVVACLDAQNGRVVWQSEIAADSPRVVMLRARPVLLGESLIVGGNDGVVRSLETRAGKPRWSLDVGAPVRALDAANVGGHPAILAVTERDIVLLDAAKGVIIERDAGAMAWAVPGGRGAIIVGDGGAWRRVSW